MSQGERGKKYEFTLILYCTRVFEPLLQIKQKNKKIEARKNKQRKVIQAIHYDEPRTVQCTNITKRYKK